jgi:hypothetical protein
MALVVYLLGPGVAEVHGSTFPLTNNSYEDLEPQSMEVLEYSCPLLKILVKILDKLLYKTLIETNTRYSFLFLILNGAMLK